MKEIFEMIGRFFKREYVKDAENKLKAAGILSSGEAFFGYLFLSSTIVAIFLTLFFYFLPQTKNFFTSFLLAIFPILYFEKQLFLFILALILFIFSFTLSVFSHYLISSAILLFLADRRKSAIENILPDFLSLVATNMRAGMPLDQAMWYAAKPEFGILSYEVKNVIKEAFSGQSFSTSLDKLSERFDSRVLKRTLSLIKQASYSGGEVAKILEITALDAKESIMLKKDIAASLLIYEIFILFSALFGAPFLFAVVNKLLIILEKAMTSALHQTTLPYFKVGFTSLITSSDFFYFSLGVIFITTLTSSMLISIIRTASKTQSIKYLPFMFLIAYSVFFLVLNFLDTFLGKMIL